MSMISNSEKTNKVFVGVYRGLSCIINSAKLEEHKLKK